MQGQFCLLLKTLSGKINHSEQVYADTPTSTNSCAGSCQKLVMKIISATAGISTYSACPSIWLFCRCPSQGPAGNR